MATGDSDQDVGLVSTRIDAASAIAPARSNDAVQAQPLAVFLARYPSADSRRAMEQSLDVIADLVRPGASAADMPWASLRYEHAEAIRARLAEKYAVSSANRHLAALRGIARVCRRMGLMSIEAEMAITDVEPVRGSDTAADAGRALAPAELVKLMAACERDDSPTPNRDARDACALTLLVGAGLRRTEAVTLRREAVVTDADGTWLTVTGKGRKTRRVPVPPGFAARLHAWAERRGTVGGDTLLVRTTSVGDVMQPEPLSASGLYHVIVELGERAGLAHFSPHDLRRTYITNLLSAGADLSTTANLVGHARLDTTRGYDRRASKEKLAAVQLVDMK